MPDAVDPFWKLRPPPATPEGELCSCSDEPPIVLVGRLGPNPVACLRCNGEVSPERIGLSAEVAEELACWRDFHTAFEHLWLDSGEFESWAKEQLESPASPVNTRGLALAARLDGFRRAYY